MAMIAPNDSRLRGILFSGFSAGECEERWVPGIEQRGVRIDRIEDLHRTLKKGEANVRGFDVALYMFERSTHGHSEILKRDCKSAGVRLILIKTAISTWPKDFRDPTELDAAGQQHTVSDADLEPFLREYQARWQKGERPFRMLDAMKRYWSVGTLQRADQLVDYVKQLGDRAPEWFREWYATEVGSQRRLVAVPAAPPSVPVIQEITKVIPPPKGLATIGEMLKVKGEEPTEYLAGRKPTITPENFDLACTEFMSRWADGEDKEAMAKAMARYWSNGELTNGNQLYSFFWNRVRTGACPPWFAEWWQKDRGARARPELQTAPKTYARGQTGPASPIAKWATNKGSSQKMEETAAKVCKHIENAKVDEACKRFREMFEAGVSFDEMRGKFVDLWTGPVPEMNDDFVNVFRGLALGARGSKSFKRWWNGARKHVKRPTVKDVRLARGLPYNNGAGTPKTKRETPMQTTTTNGTIKKAAAGVQPSLQDVIRAIEVLTNAGLMDQSEAFQRISAYASKR